MQTAFNYRICKRQVQKLHLPATEITIDAIARSGNPIIDELMAQDTWLFLPAGKIVVDAWEWLTSQYDHVGVVRG
jgi:hypothetical protein